MRILISSPDQTAWRRPDSGAQVVVRPGTGTDDPLRLSSEVGD